MWWEHSDYAKLKVWIGGTNYWTTTIIYKRLSAGNFNLDESFTTVKHIAIWKEVGTNKLENL